MKHRWRLVACAAAAGLIGLAAVARAEGPSDKRLYQLDEAGLSDLLKHLHASQPDPIKRIATLARMGIGQPYQIYLLGEFPFEDHDPDPLYCLTKSDCVTFCEHIFSMALADSFDTFLQNLQRLRYRDGQIGMLTRNHFTVADWDRNNAFLFEDLTAKLGDAKAAVPLTQVCKRARFFAKFGIGQDIPDEPIEDHYIPKANVPGILNELRTADFINIIRGDEKSQWAGHTGLIMLADDAAVNFLHSVQPVVREQPLLEYLESDRRCVGIKVLRLRDNPESRLRQAVESGKSANLTSKLSAAMKRRHDDAPEIAKPIPREWMEAMQFQAYRLDYDTPLDADLQKKLESIDRDIADRLGIPADKRAAGVLDLNNLRLAMVEPDRMFYGASVPKICILLAYFETNPDAARDLSPDVALELGRMIKVSDNETAAKYGQLIGMEKIRSIIQSDRYAFYDADHGGGLWYGKHYSRGEPRIGDPLHDHSHGATVRQCLRFYLMMEQGRLVNPAASTKMREIFATPQLEHNDAGFVKGLQGRDLTLIRKSGTWENWRLDTARIEHDGRVYLLAAMAEHEKAGDYLEALAAEVDNCLAPQETEPRP